MKTWKIMLIVTMAAAALTASAAFAAPARLTSITAAVRTPVRIAVDAQGNLYVTQASDNQIAKYDATGKYLNSIYVTGPHSVAVDASGNIYAGCLVSSKRDGLKNVVYVFAPNLSKLGSLGAGEGEFMFPADIAVDGTGRIYVVDKDASTVSVYNSNSLSTKVLSFGGFGSGNGQLTRPTSVAVNDKAGIAGEIYVADTPRQTVTQFDPTTNTTTTVVTNGARISVFDKNGIFLRSFGQYGFGTGQMTSPESIAIDQAGLLYVADSYQGAALIMSSVTGSSVAPGALYDNSIPMQNPTGIAISRNNMAYIVSKNGPGAGRIDEYGLDGYVTMDVTPKSLVYSATQFAGNPPAQTIMIASSGTGTLNWTATPDTAWIRLASQATATTVTGTAGPLSSSGLAVTADISTLNLGTYSGTVTVDSGFGQKQIVSVSVTVVAPPFLSISNGSLNFSVKKGQTAAPQNVTLAIANLQGTMLWSAVSNTGWLSIAPASGSMTVSAPSVTTSVSVNAASLVVGTYTGLITVSAPGAVGSGSTINVSLSVMPSSKITVSTNRSDAKFTVAGPATYSGSGTNWSVDGAPAGDYTVTFDAVAGYKKPFALTKTLVDSGVATFSGTYVSFADLAAKKTIVAAKGPAVANDSLLKFYKGTGTPAAADLLALTTTYGANVAVGDIDGDGSAEIIVGAGDGPNNPATVRIYRTDGSLFKEFVPFGTLNGVHVAAADLNGDGKAEIIVAPAGGSANAANVKVYAYDKATGMMVPTGIDFTAFPGLFYGANIAAADLDGNGKPYILTAPGFGRENPATVRVWKVDASSTDVTKWTVSPTPREIPLAGFYGATVAAGDVDGIGVDEIVAGTGGMANGDSSLVTIIKADGSQTTFKAFERYGVNVAVADLDGDGKAEVLAAAGRGTNNNASSAGSAVKGKSSVKMDKRGDGTGNQAAFGGTDSEAGTVRVLSGTGSVKYVLRPFDNATEGVNITVGDLAL